MDSLKKELIGMKNEMTLHMQELLEKELAKPEGERDLEAINELTDAIAGIEGLELTDDELKRNIASVAEKVSERKRPRRHIGIRWAAAACAAAVLGFNQVSLTVYGENVFSRIYHFTRGGVTINLEENEYTYPTEHSVSADDRYGIKAKCNEFGFSPKAPEYLPDGFELSEVETEEDVKSTDVRFVFVRGEEKVAVGYSLYKTDKVAVNVPAESTDLREKTVGGLVFATIREDGDYKAFCADGKLFYGLFTYGLDYAEADRILGSMK